MVNVEEKGFQTDVFWREHEFAYPFLFVFSSKKPRSVNNFHSDSYLAIFSLLSLKDETSNL